MNEDSTSLSHVGATSLPYTKLSELYSSGVPFYYEWLYGKPYEIFEDGNKIRAPLQEEHPD